MRHLLRRLALRPGARRTPSGATRATTRATQRRALFTYDLPQDRIASHPADPRGSSKLLVYRNTHLEDATFSDLDGYLPAGALVVANDSRVVRARLTCSTEGAPFEVLLLAPADATADPAALVAAGADGQAWTAMARSGATPTPAARGASNVCDQNRINSQLYGKKSISCCVCRR